MQDGEIIDYSHKDGHKYTFGSDSQAYSKNYDRIFRKKKKVRKNETRKVRKINQSKPKNTTG